MLGADSMLLENPDFLVTQLTPTKPFAFDPFFMRTKYRFIEGYRGNDTVRGWREYDSIYHAVFADMRGSRGYPKGDPYNMVPQGLLLRPAIPNDEIFGADGTYGPKANFKISLRELPDDGRFRVTVMASKYNDGLLLDPGTPPQTSNSVVWKDTKSPGSIVIPHAGVYQVDIYGPEHEPPPPDSSRLRTGLAGAWPGDTVAAGPSGGKGEAGRFSGGQGGVAERRRRLVHRPARRDPNRRRDERRRRRFLGVRVDSPGPGCKRRGLSSLGASDRHARLVSGNIRATGAFCGLKQRDAIRRRTRRVSSPPGTIRANTWQHVAAVVRRGKNETRLYVNGYLVARASTGSAQFDDTEGGSPTGAHSWSGSVSGRTGGRPSLQPAARRGRNSSSGPTRKAVREGEFGT